MTKHAVRFQHAFSSRVRGDQGQGALEYVGILIVVGVVVFAIVGAFSTVGSTAAERVATAVTNFLG